jgi:serine/threonine protein kinase
MCFSDLMPSANAVQMLMGEEPSPAADIYSFGVVLWEICCQEMPQRGRRRDPTPAEAPLVRSAPANSFM